MNLNASFRAVSGHIHSPSCTGCPICNASFRHLLAADGQRGTPARSSDVYRNPPDSYAIALGKLRAAAVGTTPAPTSPKTDVYRNPPDGYALALQHRQAAR